jgi:hypothetical protein
MIWVVKYELQILCRCCWLRFSCCGVFQNFCGFTQSLFFHIICVVVVHISLHRTWRIIWTKLEKLHMPMRTRIVQMKGWLLGFQLVWNFYFVKQMPSFKLNCVTSLSQQQGCFYSKGNVYGNQLKNSSQYLSIYVILGRLGAQCIVHNYVIVCEWLTANICAALLWMNWRKAVIDFTILIEGNNMSSLLENVAAEWLNLQLEVIWKMPSPSWTTLNLRGAKYVWLKTNQIVVAAGKINVM